MAQQLYTGSYADAGQPGIKAFNYDPQTGTLTEQGAFSEIKDPSFVLVHPNKKALYAVSEDTGTVWALRASDEFGQLQAINKQPSEGMAPCHLLLDRGGRWLVVSNYTSGTVSIYPIEEDGALGAVAATVRHEGSGPNKERQDNAHAHSAIFTPDERHIIVADLGIDALVIYHFDESNGALVEHGRVATKPGAGPRHMAFGVGGAYLYIANELDSTVGVYEYDGAGGLHEQQVISTLPPDAPENTVADIHLSAAGDRLYVSNRGHESIAAYSVEADGTLALLAIRPCGGSWPRNFAVAPDNRFLLVANQYSGTLDVLPVLDGAEALGDPVSRVAMPGASCVAFLP